MSASARPARPARRGAFAASVVTAVALNLVALGVVAAVQARWHAPQSAERQTSWITVTAPAPRAEPPTPTPSPTETRPETRPEPQRRPQREPQPDSTRGEQVPGPVAPRGLPPEPARTAPPATNPGPVGASDANPDASVRYYRSGEVDEAATPADDWNLDTALLDSAGLGRLVFEVFVSAAGEVVGCTVLEPETLAPATRIALEGRLHETRLQPARRAGLAVASVRRIEVSVSAVAD